MRMFEWLIAIVVVAMAWQWLRGRRAGLGLGLTGVMLVAVSVLVEGQRTVMWPAYVVVLATLVRSLRSPAAPGGPAGWRRKIARGVWVTTVLVASVGLPILFPVIRLPAPTGPHPVGTAWLVVRDSTRGERFSSLPGTRRELPVRLWYPAPPGAPGPSAPYAEPKEMTLGGVFPALFMGQNRLARTHSRLGVPMAAGTWPVLIFSHGYTGYVAQNTVQMEELASRGYVVFSVAHPGEAAWTVFPDGRVIPYDTAPMKAMLRQFEQARKSGMDPVKTRDSILAGLAVADPAVRKANFRGFLRMTPEPLQSESVTQWALDTKALLDRLEGQSATPGDSLFRGRLDLQRIGVFGMSYGGATAGEFCRLDARCRVAINIDGTPWGGLVDDSLRVPLLIIGSEPGRPTNLPVLDLVRGPAFLVTVPATNHLGLTDLGLQGPVFARIGITGPFDPVRRESIMTDYVVGFFEKYLMGRSPELFDGLAARYPEAGIIKRNQP